jgi:hypothetical protein
MFRLLWTVSYYVVGVPCGFAVRLLCPLLIPLAGRLGFIGPKSVLDKAPAIPRPAAVAGGLLGDSGCMWVAVLAGYADRVPAGSGYQLIPADYFFAHANPIDPDVIATKAIIDRARRAHPGCVFFLGKQPPNHNG